MDTHHHIGLMIEPLGGYRHKILTGISRYARQKPNWRIACFDRERKELAGVMESWRGDGVICTAVDPRFNEVAAAQTIPMVNVASHQLEPQFLNVVGDDRAAGAKAATFLLERGFRSFGFIRRRDNARFFAERGRGFTEVVEAAGFKAESFAVASGDEDHLTDWLASLPRPLALLGATDRLAAMGLESCWTLGLKVPEEVAVLGLGNSEPLCELCSPTLSSLDMDLERRGYEAARWLDRMLEGDAPPAEPQTIAPAHVVERRSTEIYAFEDPDVVAALRFIRNHAHTTIKVRDVVSATSISRRSLEGRFNRLINRTLHDEIWQAHFDLATRLLSSSDLPLQEVAGRSGFRTASALVNLFRQRFGQTPKEYRIANRR